MGQLGRKLFRVSAIGGAMFLADGAVCMLCPQLRGISKALACLASVTIFGSLADQGSTYALKVLDGTLNAVGKER